MQKGFTHERIADYNLMLGHSFMKYIAQEQRTKNAWFCKEEAKETHVNDEYDGYKLAIPISNHNYMKHSYFHFPFSKFEGFSDK